MSASAVKFKHGSVPQEIYNILACPMCKADVRYSKDMKSLVCVKCHAKYKIEGSVPIMLPKIKQ